MQSVLKDIETRSHTILVGEDLANNSIFVFSCFPFSFFFFPAAAVSKAWTASYFVRVHSQIPVSQPAYCHNDNRFSIIFGTISNPQWIKGFLISHKIVKE